MNWQPFSVLYLNADLDNTFLQDRAFGQQTLALFNQVYKKHKTAKVNQDLNHFAQFSYRILKTLVLEFK